MFLKNNNMQYRAFISILLAYIASEFITYNQANIPDPLYSNCTDISVKYNTLCQTCEFITGIISHEIKLANQTITEIKALVEYLCNHLGNKKQQRNAVLLPMILMRLLILS